jgi:hypothetical protein
VSARPAIALAALLAATLCCVVDAGATRVAALDDSTKDPPIHLCAQGVPLAVVMPDGGFDTTCAGAFELIDGAEANARFVVLELPPCSEGPCGGARGMRALECQIAEGYSCCFTCLLDQRIDAEPGRHQRSVIDALVMRFEGDTDRRESRCYEDYTGNGERILNMPIVAPPVRHQPLRVVALGAFFLADRPERHVPPRLQPVYLIESTCPH